MLEGYNKEKDPGKTTETIFQSASITIILPEYFFPKNHQVPSHQQKLPPFQPPDTSHPYFKPPLTTSENIGNRKPANFRNIRIKQISLEKNSKSVFLESLSLEFGKNGLQITVFLLMKHSNFQFLHTPVGQNLSKVRKKRKNEIGLVRYRKILRVSEKHSVHSITNKMYWAVDVGATHLASRALKSLDRKYKKKKKQGWCSYEIFLSVRIAGYIPSIRFHFSKLCTTVVQATSFVLLQSDSLARNFITIKHQTTFSKANGFTFLTLGRSFQDITDRKKKEDRSKQSQSMWKTGGKSSQMIVQKYWSAVILGLVKSITSNQSISRNFTLGLLHHNRNVVKLKSVCENLLLSVERDE
ncbi:hypothetical protein PGTUg99_011614 [Puccinia graminis f. sp. tritici]|uniref:Uncharacterized protein n=1 Tax=Puccinia graminis f. sp. tritici TaxID=56615 RepID=A0A5B0SDR7_PUCGR|nr:hypothetical protein PGTUg99_011614 [Puccinia graminis f. sp. tritici]